MDSTDPLDGILSVSHEQLGTTRLVRAGGEIDMTTVPVLQRETVLGEPAPALLVLDFTSVTFLDSAGLTALVELNEQCQQRRTALKIVTRDRAVLRALQITALDRLLTIVATLDEALPAERPA